MNPEQFKPQPAVDVSPNWPRPAQRVDDPVEAVLAGEPDVDAYQTSIGQTITECAVCLALGDHVSPARRPYRAVTAVDGTPVCRDHLVHLDQAGLSVGVGALVSQAAHLARAEITCCCAKLGPTDCCVPCSRGGHSHCVGPLA